MNRPSRLIILVLVALFQGELLGAAEKLTLPAATDVLAVGELLSSLSPRGEGSQAEAKVFAALRGWFDRPGNVLRETDFRKQDDFHSFSRSLWFRIPGTKPGELVVVVPTDGSRGRSNNAGLTWAIAWAEKALADQPAVSLTFLFTGAERGEGRKSTQGSSAFLKDFFPEDPAAALVLDLDDATRPVEVINGSGSFPSPIWMSQALIEALQSAGFLPEIQGTQPQIFRFDLPERRNALQVWFERGIPAILLESSSERPALNPKSGLDLTVGLTRFVDSLSEGIPGYWDRHYLYFHLGDLKFFLSQTSYLQILLGALAAILLAFLLLSRSLQTDLNALLRGIWQLPVLFSFLFLFLFAGTWWSSLLLQERSFVDFWKYNALPVLLIKVSVAIGLYFAVFMQFRRLPLSRWPGFYSYAALLTLGIGVIGSAAIELSFSFYFFWALVFAVLFHVAPWRWLKLVAFLASPVWFVKSFVEIFWLSPDPELIRISLVSTFAGNLVLAVVLFPFLLLVNSYHYQRHQRQENNEKHRSRIILAAWILLTLALSLLLLRSDPFEASATPLFREETLNLAQQTRNETVVTPIAADLPVERSLPFVNGVWDTTLSQKAFLDRLVWTVEFAAFRQAEDVTLRLTGDSNLVVYDCNFPFTVDATGTEVTILVGRTPPLAFPLRLTLGAGVTAELEINARFSSQPEREWRKGRWYLVTRRLLVTDLRTLAP